jgi:uncharacterized membrane protein
MEARRDTSLDVARGLIVALMALDHVRIFFSAAQFDPMDLDHTSIGWYLSRWVTHLCAPGFFFIMGLSASLIEERTSKRETARFLVVRGLWLIFLELTVFGLAWSFNPGWFWFGVIFGLGAAMLVLAALLFLPRVLLMIAAAAFIALHNELWTVGAPPGVLESLLYSGGLANLHLLGPHLVLYSVLPWAALTILGYASARWTMPGGKPNIRLLAVAGAAMIAAFPVLRLAGFGEGDAPSFNTSEGTLHNVLAFFAIDKYPASLLFALLTLGIMALALACFALLDRRQRLWLLAPLRVYGKVPFFFYLLHLFLIHGLALGLAAALGWPTDYLFWTEWPNMEPPDGYGFGLGGVLLIWALVLGLLYPACRWFGRLKAESRVWWMRFL